MFDELGQVFDMMLIRFSLAHLAVNTFRCSTVGFFLSLFCHFYVIDEVFAGFVILSGADFSCFSVVSI